MASGDPYVTITEPTFVARFLLDSHTDTAESVANVDAFVDLPNGSSWALTIFTVDEVRHLLTMWKHSGEACTGSSETDGLGALDPRQIRDALISEPMTAQTRTAASVNSQPW